MLPHTSGDSAATAMAHAEISQLELLIGVMSYRSSVAFGRRQSIRQMLLAQQVQPRAALRFVLSRGTPDKDGGAPDMLLFNVADNSRTLGTYLLNNAFFRYAVALQPPVAFIARADDDSYFDVPTVLAELGAAARGAAWHGQGGPAFVYGHFHEWYMWSPSSMQASCFGFGHTRHRLALARLGQVKGDGARLPRFQRECLHDGLVGPYPFAKGPLVAFSHSVASRLVSLPELAEDEQYALGGRRRTPLVNVIDGRLYPITKGGHPRRAVVFDDIYYGYLLLRAYRHANLSLVHARISEFDKKLVPGCDRLNSNEHNTERANESPNERANEPNEAPMSAPMRTNEHANKHANEPPMSVPMGANEPRRDVPPSSRASL